MFLIPNNTAYLRLLLWIIIFITYSPNLIAQDSLKYDVLNNQGQFSAVVVVPHTSKETLFKRSKEWVYKTYVSGNAVIDIADPETSKISANGITGKLVYKNSFVKVDAGHFTYALTIYTKDGKAKIVFGSIIHKGGEMLQMKDGSNYSEDFPSAWGSFGKSQSKKQWALMKEQADKEFLSIFISFKGYLQEQDQNAEF